MSLKHQIGVPRSILPSERGHRSSPRRARQRQHEHRTAMRHVVVHVLRSDLIRTSCARGGGRASALKACRVCVSLPSVSHTSPSRVGRRHGRVGRPRARRGLREGGRAAWGAKLGAVDSTCDGFFLGTDSTLQTRPQNGARPCAIMHLWHARAYGRRARYRQSSARKRREYGVMRGTLSTACLLVPFDTKAAS